MRRAVTNLMLVFALGMIPQLASAAAVAAVQFGTAVNARGPRFLLASATRAEPVRIDIARTPLLHQQLSLRLDNVTPKEALAEISRKAGLDLVYGDDILPTAPPVNLHAERISVAAALTEVLISADVDVVFTPDGRATLVPQPPAEALPGTITGTVTVAETQEPVASAQVAVEGTGLGTLTNNDGEFSIAGVPAGRQTVTVSSIGYRTITQEADVVDGATVTVDFVLDVSPSALNEIVVTATGRQRRVEIGNAIATIRADSVVREAPVNSLTDLISGRAAGVQVMHSSGLAGSTPRIRIRGLNSAALPNDPILVVDGVRVDHSTGMEASVFGVAQGGRLNDINPEEIESLEVVKGPSAATLYGTEAANGVIVITTKRGRTGPARWSAWTEQALSTKALDEFRENFIAWGHTPSDPTPQRCTIPNAASGACMVDSIASFNPLNLEETSPFTTGHRQEYGLQVSGGSERVTYLLSGELSDEDGYLRMPPAEVERMEAIHGAGAVSDPDFQRPNTQRQVSLRANVRTALGEHAEVSVRANYVNTRSLSVTGADGGSVVASATYGPGFRDENNGYFGFTLNPGELFAMKMEETVDRFVGSLSGQWQPVAWLATRGTVGLDVGSSAASSFSPTGIGVTPGGRIAENSLRNLGYSVDLGATVTVPLAPRLRSATSVGTQYNRRDQQGLSVDATGLPPGSRSPSAATGFSSITSTIDESYVLGAYVQEQLSLNDRVFVIGAVRADGGSAFGEDVTFAAYPKASVSWVVSEEPFFPRSSVLTSLRLRSAWGASGVQPRRTDVVRSYTPGAALIHGEVASAASVTALGNADLKPERQREVEVGIEAELFENRVSLEASYYNRVSKDALVSVPVLPSTAFGFNRLENVGSVRNRGVEGALRVAVLDTRPFAWELRVSGSYNQNRLLELAAGVSSLDVGTPGFDPFRHAEGFPLFGVWERPVSFEDDGDGVITASEVEVGDTAVFWGPSHPPRELTVASTVSLFDRRVRVGAQFDYRGGHFRYDAQEQTRCTFSSSCRGLNDPSAPLAEQAAAQAALGPLSVVPVRDASFTRFRELAVTYFVPEHVTRLVGGRPVSVTLSGRNLALWTDVAGDDPEAAVPFTSLTRRDQSVNLDGFPQSRIWSVRVQVGN